MADRTAKQEAKLDYMAFAVAGVAGGHGVMEYMKAANIASLGIGLGFGSLIALSGYRTTYNKDDAALGLVSSGLLAALRGKQFYDTQKTPYGVVAGAALLLAVRSGGYYLGFLKK